MQLSISEENYLKAIFSLSWKHGELLVSTNQIAHQLDTAAASVTDMVKKLSEKKLVIYERYKGVTLSKEGDKVARRLIRKHRLWEVFLVDKLGFNWDEVHELAEQLEHIQSPELIKRIDKFLGYPKTDPHGDPIPDEQGNMKQVAEVRLSDVQVNQTGVVLGVNDTSKEFLQYLDALHIQLGIEIVVIKHIDFDQSVLVKWNEKEQMLSKQVAENLFVRVLSE